MQTQVPHIDGISSWDVCNRLSCFMCILCFTANPLGQDQPAGEGPSSGMFPVHL